MEGTTVVEIELLITPEWAGDLASRIMTLWPEPEVMVAGSLVRFALPENRKLDLELSRLEELLQKVESIRNVPIQDVRLRSSDSRNWCGDVLEVGRFVIHDPRVDVAPDPGRLVMVLESGPAFGSGSHPSTLLSLGALDEFFRPPPGAPSRQGASVLDVGAGSGILSLASVLGGAGTVLAIDISEEAVIMARKNLALNLMEEKIQVKRMAADQAGGSFDLVLANLAPSVLIRSIKHLSPRLAEDGRMVVAGFGDFQTPQVLRAATKHGLIPEKSYSKDGWAALTLRRD